ncbi:hypothetical protein Q6A51_13435 [Pseudomonas sp. KFB-139]|uniref:Uncharacterized protein n=1 Tax=Pseudomonas serbiensis TaxID=3064350 RepID=A0ABT9CQL9_9PSED|nr:hypothetical protein [Pseudomonas sp. KFB-138]
MKQRRANPIGRQRPGSMLWQPFGAAHQNETLWYTKKSADLRFTQIPVQSVTFPDFPTPQPVIDRSAKPVFHRKNKSIKIICLRQKPQVKTEISHFFSNILNFVHACCFNTHTT